MLSQEQIGNALLALPDRSTQQRIAGYLDGELQALDAVVEKIYEGVARLKEYRTSLISAAVTGKIDVREETD
jgi:restriction endonuclease S subunit